MVCLPEMGGGGRRVVAQTRSGVPLSPPLARTGVPSLSPHPPGQYRVPSLPSLPPTWPGQQYPSSPPLPGQDRITLPPLPPPGQLCGRAVCLLRSRRRTVSSMHLLPLLITLNGQGFIWFFLKTFLCMQFEGICLGDELHT